MITIQNLSKTYNEGKENEVKVLKDISLTIKKKEMVAVMGTSGAGKSTLLHILGCLERPSSGKYYLEEEDVSGLNNKKLAAVRNSKIGFVMQNFALIEEETVEDNIYVPVYFSKTKMSVAEKKVKDLAEQLGISKLLNKKVNKLSGGEKQRTAIARALINDPDIILADEPTGALDTENTEIVMDIFRQLNEIGKTIIIITHDVQVAQKCARRLYIEDGKIVER